MSGTTNREVGDLMIEKYSPLQVSALIRSVDPGFYDPTPEQAAIISIVSNPFEPAVVIAGAGSGKTETMASRVVYLVANGFVKPDQILGLTFTRKAAGELSARIRKRLRQLQVAMEKAGLQVPFTTLDTSVTTYHSYAGRLLSEHAIRFGIDADAQPMGEAALWMSANTLVSNWNDPDFIYEGALNTAIEDVMGLASLVLEHQVSLESIRAADEKTLAELAQFSGGLNDEVRAVARTARQRIALLPLVERFIETRRSEGELSFDDQVSLAADIAMKFPDVATIERGKYAIVLLDEYQDTSQSQVRLLSALFGNGHPVTAVGDPCQSIYTWRGASAGTIGSFKDHFPKAPGSKGREIYELLTTYRNDEAILELANEISLQVRSLGGLDVSALKARPGAGKGDLVVGLFETMEAEATAIAEYIQPHWNNPERLIEGSKVPKSFAVLVRKRSQIPAVQSALGKAGIECDVVGLSGLVHVPEIADIVAMLSVIADPDAGASLMRILTGPHMALGAADIAALGAYSRSLAKESASDSRSLVKKIVAGNPDSAEADDQFLGSLIDALDDIATADKSHFSQIGYQRLTEFAADLRRLRSRSAGAITDLIAEIERYLNLEVEVLLRDGTRSGRRHIDRFMDEAAKFARNGASLSAFLQWLSIASREEGGLKAGAAEVNFDAVQILTIHSAKGAEWDLVAVPGLAQGTFPSDHKGDPDNWITNERHIPFALRGDGGQLPLFSWNGATSNADAGKAVKKFKEQCNRFKEQEEIRLGYVAMTRAKTHLICTSSWWRDGQRQVPPSSIFEQAQSVATRVGRVINLEDAPIDGAKNPLRENPASATWPHDALGDRRQQFNNEIALVLSKAPISLDSALAGSSDSEVSSWIRDSQAIINEFDNYKSALAQVALPPRLATSTLIALHEDPAALALSIRRPMPRASDEFSRRGTAFHLWIERHFNSLTFFDDEDFDLLEPLEADQTLEELKNAWLASPWAGRTPHAVEVPFETVIAGVLIRGRIDAVYKDGDSYEVIDWKTGSKKLGKSAAIQLAVYRLAWATLQNIELEKVSGAFHYVPTGVTDRPTDLMGRDELIALLEQFNS
jgi:DNA helicase II / ATP-dependent DNA helicase PcrA